MSKKDQRLKRERKRHIKQKERAAQAKAKAADSDVPYVAEDTAPQPITILRHSQSVRKAWPWERYLKRRVLNQSQAKALACIYWTAVGIGRPAALKCSDLQAIGGGNPDFIPDRLDLLDRVQRSWIRACRSRPGASWKLADHAAQDHVIAVCCTHAHVPRKKFDRVLAETLDVYIDRWERVNGTKFN